MSNQIVNKTRRKFLQGTAYVSALSMTGLSLTAFTNSALADSSKEELLADARILGDSDIRIIQETLNDREKVTLINQSEKLQMIDARKPISLHQADGKLVVTVNQNDADAINGMVVMSPNEHLTFDIKSLGTDLNNKVNSPALVNLTENQLQISSEHSVFNRVVAVELA